MHLLNRLINLTDRNKVSVATGVILLLVLFTNFRHGDYLQSDGVIEWDVKSYYAWLPAALIHKDLSLSFRGDNIEKYGELIWPVETPKGKQAIVTTMGMAVLYSPLFLAAHLTALFTPWEADGYSLPYRFALAFGGLFALWAGLVFLIKVLRRFFSEGNVAITIVAVAAGTNLFYYSTYEAAMSHVYNFALIACFLWLTIRFWEKPSARLIIVVGLLGGLITLIRPVNIIVLVLFFLWNTASICSLKLRMRFLISHYRWIVLMALSFILVWVPQFIYWKWISGQFFYFSYGELGGRFFFGNPQITNILFSFKKGWLIYTPVMIFSLSGIILLIIKRSALALPVTLFTLVNIYILSSWWNWWYGGGFGLRSFVDSYAVMAIPFAAFTTFIIKRPISVKGPVIGLVGLLVFYNLFQTRQYMNNAIHWWWMNREAYRETFLRLHPTDRFWDLVTLPDHDLARQGIYREIKPEPRDVPVKDLWRESPDEEELISWIAQRLRYNDEIIEPAGIPEEGEEEESDSLLFIRASELLAGKGREFYVRERALELLIREMQESPEMNRYLRRKAEERGIPFDSMLKIDAIWIYKNQR